MDQNPTAILASFSDEVGFTVGAYHDWPISKWGVPIVLTNGTEHAFEEWETLN